jgi:DNA repair exonuclease SbcCD ATPase subunit
MKKILLAITTTALCTVAGCQWKQENEQLKLENEELKAELHRAELTEAVLEEVGVMMDSIDKARNALRFDLESGTSYDDYLERMQEIKDYVDESEAKITQLEKEISQTSTESRRRMNLIAQLKKDLAEASLEVEKMSSTVESYKGVNRELIKLVDMQEAELDDMENEIEQKTEELELIENKIQELLRSAQMSEADAFFARAQAMEEAANRTKLAPRKKKETYAEALDLYKKALAYGREDAEPKIKELEDKI